VALLGLGLLGLALVGAPSLPRLWRWRAAALAATGLVLALAGAVPGVGDAYGWLSRTAVGAPLREGQRFVVLILVWLAPAAALGAARLAGDRGRFPAWATLAVPAAAAVVLAGPGAWGVGGRLEPSSLPSDWRRARQIVVKDPGPLLALPYVRYLDLPTAGGRRVLNPVPDYFGGDVLSSSDPQAGPASASGYRERADPREPTVLAALTRALGPERSSGSLSDALAGAGVRWVVLLHAADWKAYAGVVGDPGLVPVVRGGSLDLLEVAGWKASVVDDAGAGVGRRPLVAPLEHLDASPAALWAQPAEPGWMRGTHAAGRSASGLVRLPAGRGLLWFWPAAAVITGDALIVACVALWSRLCGVAVSTCWRWRGGRRRWSTTPGPVSVVAHWWPRWSTWTPRPPPSGPNRRSRGGCGEPMPPGAAPPASCGYRPGGDSCGSGRQPRSSPATPSSWPAWPFAGGAYAGPYGYDAQMVAVTAKLPWDRDQRRDGATTWPART